jgi:hypothetical protein
MITVTVGDLDAHDFDTEVELIAYALETVGEFASDVDAEVDVTLEGFNRWAAWVNVEVTGADEDVALFSRRWFEE